MPNSSVEHEAKILNIDVEKIKQKIISAGGTIGKEFHFRRYVFDIIPAEKGKWIRLRTNGEKTTLALKEITSKEITGTSEWEVEVSDFEETFTILRKSGFQPKGYQENKRIECRLDGAELAIDVWPQLAPYLEIEAVDEANVNRIAKILGYSSKALTAENTIDLYEHIGIDLDKVEDLRFTSAT